MSKHHVAFALSYLRRQLKSDQLAGEAQSILTDDDGPLTYPEAFAAIQEKQDAGFEVWPPCDNVRPDGSCLGHDEI